MGGRTQTSAAEPKTRRGLTRELRWLLATASGVAVANIYYNQPMLADIGRTFGVNAHDTGLVATATQIGYAVGMPLFIPLGDFIDRRTLVTCLFVAVACALAFAAAAPNIESLIILSFLIGATTVIAQILIPLATELVDASEQGKTIGSILTGVLLGILLARTVSGAVAEHFGWRVMFAVAAVAAFIFAAVLRFRLPSIETQSSSTWIGLMRSIGTLVVELPKLRQVSFVAAMFLASFMTFWPTLVYFLQTPPYHYGA